MGGKDIFFSAVANDTMLLQTNSATPVSNLIKHTGAINKRKKKQKRDVKVKNRLTRKQERID